MAHTKEEIAQAKKAAKAIEKRIEDATRKLEVEMRIMDWKPEYRVIVWEALARRAWRLAEEATR